MNILVDLQAAWKLKKYRCIKKRNPGEKERRVIFINKTEDAE